MFFFLLHLSLFPILSLGVTETSVYGFILFPHFTYSFDDIIHAYSFDCHIKTCGSYLYIFSSEPFFNSIFSQRFQRKIQVDDLKSPAIPCVPN